jgi:hypothetical protein
LVKAKVEGKFKVRVVDLRVEQLAKLKDLYEAALGANVRGRLRCLLF